MSAPATPRQSLLGRFVGSISRYVPTPNRGTTPSRTTLPEQATATSPQNQSVQETQTVTYPTLAPAAEASAPTATSTHTPSERPPPTEEWHPGMIQLKHISEMESMWNDIMKTPPRRIGRQSQTCPPKWRNTRANVKGKTQTNIQANGLEMPRSAMKKRPAPINDEEPVTPSNNKRVKFNATLTQERIISPPHSGERDSVLPNFSSLGKKRPRATDPYTGKHFADSPNIFDEESSSKRARLETGDESTCDSENTPITQTNTNMNAAVHDAGYFVPNRTQPRPGTFELNYDTYGEGDESSISEDGVVETETETELTQTYNPPSSTTIPGRFILEYSDESINADTSTQSLLNNTTPTPLPSQRQNPPPATKTTSPPPALEPSTTTNALSPLDDQPPTPPPPPNTPTIDAEIAALPWPEPTTYVEAGIAPQHVIDLLTERYDDDDKYYAEQWWDREFEKFGKALSTAKAGGVEVVVEY